MNPRYGQMLKTLKMAYEQQMPKYQQQLNNMIKTDIKEISDIVKQINIKIKQLQAESNPQKIHELNFSKSKLAIYLDMYYRIKRFLLIYHNNRLNKLQSHFWYYGGNLPESTKLHLSQQQKSYFNQYKQISTNYMQQVELQLTIDLDPPTDPIVQVRFLKNCGQILSDDGEVIKLQKNVVILIKKRLIEQFIKEKAAEIIDSQSYM